MREILHWLETNREWVFSGAGVAIVAGILAVLRAVKRKIHRPPSTITSDASTATSGTSTAGSVVSIRDSTVAAGRDLNLSGRDIVRKREDQ